MTSEKASGADNQQERFNFANWLVGFTDGEGCFTISFFTHPKSRLRLKWQVFPEFVITQEEKSHKALKEMQEFFGCGKIYLNKRRDNHHQHLLKFVVRDRDDLLTKIIPFFENYPLRSAKINDFRIFAKILHIMQKGGHLQESGLAKIRILVQKMNTRKYR
ncbi:endonuclease [bacterium (Candidatus Gribaldobacteria) CG10_big_fil_rev_8_21_14_0_10_41_12]|uniref:Endonuclease n=1 Tax=bacterium (Candidatus Gribaldobacteria) CG10_big_fil_rev_8_21_14_0_10_41_12 TaxID=2014277 RepID=A0A2H0UWU3_9BACT|nr:MAG: endonuclease [bacterium (Candidatus Gribaldobacteria) CG10_big_fil_rev_8_21_14_0_10_41_12]